MEMRERILSEARRLAVETGALPSLNAVAAAAGVSKGGLIHHFPSRDALLEALARETLADVDREMTAAAAEGRAAATWLRVSIPSESERTLFRVLITASSALDGSLSGVIRDAEAATARWEELMAAEVGGPVRARLVRLVGDGLAANALLSDVADLSDEGIDELLAAIVRPDGSAE
jgi:AcrR family transcriptional regulator